MDLVKPPALRRGDLVAVVAPGGPVDPERLELGIATLESRGFRVRAPTLVAGGYRYFSATDAERSEALLAAVDDPGVRAIWWARGGYGGNRLLPGLPAARFRERPSLHVGFSDATAWLEFLVGRAGLAALHGPMVASDLAARPLDEAALDHVLGLAAGNARWQIPVPTALREGVVEGPVRGGCLSVLCALLGTPWRPSFAGAIAFLEDVNERPLRRIDRLLWQLRQSGALDGVLGIVFGEMPGCGPSDELRLTIESCLAGLDVPIGFDAPIGHGSRNLAIPLGVPVRLVLGGREAAAAAPGAAAGRIEGTEPVVQLA